MKSNNGDYCADDCGDRGDGQSLSSLESLESPVILLVGACCSGIRRLLVLYQDMYPSWAGT